MTFQPQAIASLLLFPQLCLKLFDPHETLDYCSTSPTELVTHACVVFNNTKNWWPKIFLPRGFFHVSQQRANWRCTLIFATFIEKVRCIRWNFVVVYQFSSTWNVPSNRKYGVPMCTMLKDLAEYLNEQYHIQPCLGPCGVSKWTISHIINSSHCWVLSKEIILCALSLISCNYYK